MPSGTGVVVRVKQPLAMPALHVGVLVRVPADLLLIQFPEDVPGKAVEDAARTCIPATHM